MKKVYIKPEMTAVQMGYECNLMAASITTTVSNEPAEKPSYGKGNSGMSESLWDD